MIAILTGALWLITLAEAFRFGYITGKKERKRAAPEASDRERREAEKAERELNNMLTYDGSEQ